jgi:MEDS: MEthanogen/methylotroph, DcmR Sensory domain
MTDERDRSRGEPPKSMPFTNASLGRHRHICALFRSREEEYRVLLPFIKEGIERGERAFHVVDPLLRQEHIQRLLEAGLDLLTAMKQGQFQLYDWDQAYFPAGSFNQGPRFDQHRMIAYWREFLEGTERQGYPLTRLVAQMDWALEDRQGVQDLLEYEARCNLLYAGRRDVVVCVYDVRRYRAEVILDVMRAHPVVVIGDNLQENPFYVPPDAFLQELRNR